MQSRTRAAVRRSFPAVSSVTTPESANETLVGCTAILETKTLTPMGQHFPTTKDREFWSWLEVHALK